MAEVLGVVASGFGVVEFALTLGESISKLRRLWKDTQEAPETIEALKSEVSLLETVLSCLQDGSGSALVPATGPLPISGTPTTNPITTHCRAALRDLHTLIEDLSSEINSARRRRRVLARLNVVLKKGDVERFQIRLDKALGLLQLALSVLQATQFGYQSTQLETVSNMLVQLTTLAQAQQAMSTEYMHLLKESKKPLQGHVIEDTEDADGPMKRRSPIIRRRQRDQRVCLAPVKSSMFGYAVLASSRSEDLSVYKARLQLPSWLSQKAWDLAFDVSTFGWQTSLVTFNIVSKNSLVFRYAREGNVSGMRKLFSQGLASPLDCSRLGRTLVDEASFERQPAVVEELLGYRQIQRLSNWSPERWAYTLLTGFLLLLGNTQHQWDERDQRNSQVLHLLVGRDLLDLIVDSYDSQDHVEPTFRKFWCLEIILSSAIILDTATGKMVAIALDWYSIPPREMDKRLRGTTILRALPYHDRVPDALRMLVRPSGPVAAQDVQRWAEDGVSLFQLVLYCFGCYAGDKPATGWTVLVKEIVLAGADLHSSIPTSEMFRHNDTPLELVSAVLLGASRAHIPYNAFKVSKSARTKLVSFLEIISDCGIDPEAFGTKGSYLETGQYDIRIRNRCWDQSLWLKRIYCAAKLEDWRLEWEFGLDSEELVGDFWQLIETPVQPVPGAWPESESEPDWDWDWDTESAESSVLYDTDEDDEIDSER